MDAPTIHKPIFHKIGIRMFSEDYLNEFIKQNSANKDIKCIQDIMDKNLTKS